MNVEIVAEAAQFPEKEYINGIAFAVYVLCGAIPMIHRSSKYVSLMRQLPLPSHQHHMGSIDKLVRAN